MERPRVVQVALLGGFSVASDGEPVPSDLWSRRHAAALVKLLALAPGRRLHREQVIDALWPDDGVDDAAPKLHKAAHFARRVLGDADAIVLRGESVALYPDPAVEVDVDAVAFTGAVEAALRDGDDVALGRALDGTPGDLLPADPYDEWLDGPRRHLRQLRSDGLRRLGRWSELVALEPTDEQAHVALMRSLAAAGDHHGVLRQYERLDKALARELGVGPGATARALRDAATERTASAAGAELDGPSLTPPLTGRGAACDAVEDALDAVARGEGRTVLVSGIPGVGKSAMLDWARARTESRGWCVGSGVAAAVEGAWAYSPVLEALADVCRRHPQLLERLDGAFRTEIERALSGAELDWSGEGGQQRLFVAAAELLRLAAGAGGAVLFFDDVHEADEASLRLIHYLARCATTERIGLVLAHRPVTTTGAGAGPNAFEQVRTSLVSRTGAVTIALEPLAADAAATAVRSLRPDVDDAELARIVDLAGGIPFALAELARPAAAQASWHSSVDTALLSRLPTDTRDLLQRVALLGTVFDTDEFLALGAPDGSAADEDAAFAHLDAGLATGILQHTGAAYRFRHNLLREALLRDIAPHRRRRIHLDAARQLERLGASPARVGHHLLAAGDVRAAAPYLLRAAEREAAVGAFRDALDLVDQVLAHVEGPERAKALARRADLLFALGDQRAVVAFRDALEVASGDQRALLLARLARAATAAGDLETGAAALAGLQVAAEAPAEVQAEVMLARGNHAFFSNDLDEAWKIAEEARHRVLAGEKSWQVVELVALQGLLAHTRGEWFDRLRVELLRTRESPEVATAIFDGYLCPAEYLLYGPTPYPDVIRLGQSLRDTARKAGALRAEAFACALSGEAALLAGELDLAEADLRDAVELHHDVGAAGGEAHSLQRLAEVLLARGDREGATALLERAVPLARWSMISLHVLQRIFGTMILAAPEPGLARAVLDRAEATLGIDDACPFCNVMLALPAVMACARVGDLPGAHRHLETAERSAHLWDGTSLQAALHEARGHLAEAEGDAGGARVQWGEAARLFAVSGQPLDTARCRVLARS